MKDREVEDEEEEEEEEREVKIREIIFLQMRTKHSNQPL